MTIVEQMAKAMYLAYANHPDARWDAVDPRMQEGVWRAHARVALVTAMAGFVDPVVRAALQAALDEK